MDPAIIELQNRVSQLEQKRVTIETDLLGMFEVVSAVPTLTPRTAYDQIKIYSNSTTYRLYWYDWVNNAWRYATGT